MAEIDLSEFQATSTVPCVVGKWLEKQTKADKNNFEAAFVDKQIMSRMIFRAARKRGATFAESTLRRHRDKDCTCQ